MNATHGTNGAGKSTPLNMIAASVRPAAGSVLLDGEDVTGSPVHRPAAFAARVFQGPVTGPAPALTIEENLALAHLRFARRGLRLALNRQRRREYLLAGGPGRKAGNAQWPSRSRTLRIAKVTGS